MSAYPTTLPISEFQQKTRDGRASDVAADGLTRIRKLHTDRAGEITFVHIALTTAQVATLAAHYTANLASSFDFVSRQDGVTYTVAYAAAPLYKLHYGGRTSISVRLTQTA